MLWLPPATPPWLEKSVLCKCNVSWWFLTQHRMEQGEQGFLLSVSSKMMGLWDILVFRDCDIWCSALWKLTGVWPSCSTSLASHMQAKHWKALQGMHWGLHNVHKEVKCSSVSSIRLGDVPNVRGEWAQLSLQCNEHLSPFASHPPLPPGGSIA